MDARAQLRSLARDNARGASEIAQRARELIPELAEQAEAPQQAVQEAIAALIEAHPSMAPLIHLADETLTTLDSHGPTALSALQRERRPAQRVAHHAAGGIDQAEQIVTYSRSGTVLAAIEPALEQTGDLAVTLSEARPGREGVDVARQLADAGADVQLTYDAALPAMVGKAGLVLVGADAITAQAFVNKTGTRTLLEQAQRASTPTRLLASRDKLWPAALETGPSLAPEGSLDLDLPEAVETRAPLFERVPLELVDRIVTEEGPHEPACLADRARTMEIHPGVVDALGR